jgi:acyl-ACP thioesterase
VRTGDTSPHGLTTPPALCGYLQDAAGLHAEHLGFGRAAMRAEGRAWVLAYLRLAVMRPPRWRERLTLHTWPSGVERLFATREFVLTRADEAADTDAPLVRATSAWAMLDLSRRRPVRPTGALLNLEPPDRPHALPHAFGRLPLPDDDAADPGADLHAARFPVRVGDLDVNEHVNNVRYVAWAVDALPAAVPMGHRLRALEVQFRAEMTLGETAHVRACPADPGDVLADAFDEDEDARGDADRAFHHVVRRLPEAEDGAAASDDANAPAALLRTRWTPVDEAADA